MNRRRRHLQLLLLTAPLAFGPRFAAAQLTAVGSQYWDQNSLGIDGTYEIGDQFGKSLATGDFNCDGHADLAIGVPYEDIAYDCNGDGDADSNECIEAGAVQVIYGSELGLHASAGRADQLLDQDSSGVPGVPEDGDHFGWAVAAVRVPNSNCDDLAVGAPDENISFFGGEHQNAGAVYYFRGTPSGLVADGDFVQGQDNVPESPESFDRFGATLAAGPRINSDDNVGCPEPLSYDATLAIGAPGEIVGFSASGAVIMVVAPCDLAGAGTGGLPSHYNCWPLAPSGDCQVIGPNDGGSVGRAGAAIATSGRIGDPFPPLDFLAIGGPGDDEFSPDAGASSVWSWHQSEQTPDGFVRESVCAQGIEGASGSSESGDEQGSALAVGDFDGDDTNDLVVGAPFEDVNGNSVANAGGINIYYTGDGWYPAGGGPPASPFFDQDDLDGDPAQSGDHFGAALASGDFDDDGFDDLAIGVPDENLPSAGDAGAFHVMYGSATGLGAAGNQYWNVNDEDLLGDAFANAHFGKAMAAGDFDDDGRLDLAVSEPGASGDNATGGGVQVLYGGLPSGFLDAVDFDRSPNTFSEAAGSVSIEVLRTGNVTLPLDVYVGNSAGGTAGRNGVDYDIPATSLHWNGGDGTSKSFTIEITNDTIDEPNESILLVLSPSAHCQPPATLWNVTISDDDPNVAGTIQLSDDLQSRLEHQGPVTVTVTRAAGTTAGASVRYTTLDGTALAGSDYVAQSGTLTFTINELSRSFEIELIDDPWDEASQESFTFVLSQPGGGATLGTPTVQTLVIRDSSEDIGLFGDGFESGSTNNWSATAP